MPIEAFALRPIAYKKLVEQDLRQERNDFRFEDPIAVPESDIIEDTQSDMSLPGPTAISQKTKRLISKSFTVLKILMLTLFLIPSIAEAITPHIHLANNLQIPQSAHSDDIRGLKRSEADKIYFSVSGIVPYHRQRTGMSCVPALYSIVLRYYGFNVRDEVDIKNLSAYGVDRENKYFSNPQDLYNFIKNNLSQDFPVIVEQYPRDEHGRFAYLPYPFAKHVRLVIGIDKAKVLLHDTDLGENLEWNWNYFLSAWKPGEKYSCYIIKPDQHYILESILANAADDETREILQKLAGVLKNVGEGKICVGRIINSIANKKAYTKEIAQSLLNLYGKLKESGIEDYTIRSLMYNLSIMNDIETYLGKINSNLLIDSCVALDKIAPEYYDLFDKGLLVCAAIKCDNTEKLINYFVALIGDVPYYRNMYYLERTLHRLMLGDSPLEKVKAFYQRGTLNMFMNFKNFLYSIGFNNVEITNIITELSVKPFSKEAARGTMRLLRQIDKMDPRPNVPVIIYQILKQQHPEKVTELSLAFLEILDSLEFPKIYMGESIIDILESKYPVERLNRLMILCAAIKDWTSESSHYITMIIYTAIWKYEKLVQITNKFQKTESLENLSTFIGKCKKINIELDSIFYLVKNVLFDTDDPGRIANLLVRLIEVYLEQGISKDVIIFMIDKVLSIDTKDIKTNIQTFLKKPETFIKTMRVLVAGQFSKEYIDSILTGIIRADNPEEAMDQLVQCKTCKFLTELEAYFKGVKIINEDQVIEFLLKKGSLQDNLRLVKQFTNLAREIRIDLDTILNARGRIEGFRYRSNFRRVFSGKICLIFRTDKPGKTFLLVEKALLEKFYPSSNIRDDIELFEKIVDSAMREATILQDSTLHKPIPHKDPIAYELRKTQDIQEVFAQEVAAAEFSDIEFPTSGPISMRASSVGYDSAA